MKKELVNKFDLEAAFKALDEIETPVVKGIKANRVNLQERFTKKLTSEVLIEDYYDVNDTADLEAAQEDREAEIAKAKLARIEKIVDLDAESEEDLLPSYVGKVIIQCPQCMTLFYKNMEDIEKSEENPEVVNINEICQHCGNSSGYTLVGKVDTVGEEEAEEYDLDAFDENELDLDFPEEGTEEVDPDGTGEAAEEEEEVEDLELEPVEEAEQESDDEDEEVKESLTEDFEDEEEFEAEEATAETEATETEEVVEDEIEEAEEILTSVEEIKEVAEEAAEAVLEVSEEEPVEDIKEITDEVVEDHFEISEEEAVEDEEAAVEDEVSEEEVVEENLTEEWVDSVKSFKNPVVICLQAEHNMTAAIIEAGTETEAIEIDKQATAEYEEAGEEAESGWQYFEWIAEDKNFKYCMIHDIYEEAFADIEYGKTISVEEAKQRLMKEDPEEAEHILTEAVDKELDDKLKAHNEYVEYLKEMIEKEEKALANAKNDFVKKSIQSRIDALKADLEAALPDALKDEVVVNDELPTPEEAKMEDAAENKEETKESLKETYYACAEIDGEERRFPFDSRDEAKKYIDMIQKGEAKEFEGKKIGSTWTEGLTEETSLDTDVKKSGLKRNLSKTELLVRELVKHELFNGLSKRVVERELLSDYITNMGRDNLSVESVVNYYKEIGIGTFILDNIKSLDKEQIVALAKKDHLFIESLIEYADKYNMFDDYYVRPESVENCDLYMLHEIIFEEAEELDFLPQTVKEVNEIYLTKQKDLEVVAEDCKVKEEVEVDLDALLDSPEFKKPISDAEVKKYITDKEVVEESVEPGVESELEIQEIVDTWESLEDLNEEAFNKHVTAYLTEVYSNVKDFVATECNLESNKLIIEGLITFNSGRTKVTTFVFEDINNKLAGTNKELAENASFVLNYKLENKTLITESLQYSYTINNTLVEGLTK